MKKTAALILVIIMLLSLFACAEKQTAAAPSESAQASASENGTPSTESETDASQSAAVETGAAEGTGTVGFITDEVDYFARDPYEIAYIYALSVPINPNVIGVLEKLGEKMNFNINSYCAEGDMAKYIDLTETCIDTGTDGFIFMPQNDIILRADELCTEADVPLVVMLTAYTDEDGRNLRPIVGPNCYDAGASVTEWAVNNFKDYFPDAELSDIGYMTINFSVAQEFMERTQGAQDKYLQLHPELADNLYDVDLADIGFSIDAGYDKAAATMSANSDVAYWILFGAAEEFAVGAARAVESLQKEDSAIVVSTGCDTCFDLWANEGDTPCWVATVPVYKTDLAVPIACGLVALMDQRATYETLWADMRKEGDFATQYNIPVDVVTRDTYLDYIAQSEAVFDQF